MSLIRDIRGGRDNDPRFGSRMRGEGQYAALIAHRMKVAKRRAGIDDHRGAPLDVSRFMPPREANDTQLGLFGQDGSG
jgi:hypothetical protein